MRVGWWCVSSLWGWGGAATDVEDELSDAVAALLVAREAEHGLESAVERRLLGELEAERGLAVVLRAPVAAAVAVPALLRVPRPPLPTTALVLAAVDL